MKLIIVESPTKARTLSKFLGTGYEIQASMGHIVDLPKSKLGVDIDKNFEPQYIQVKGKSDVVKKLTDWAAKAETIYLATDPDREGEAIAWHIANLLTNKKKTKTATKNFQRVTFHEITKTAIEASLKNPGAINMHLVDAQQARRVVDRLVGYQLSPVLWKKVRRGLSAGRVQSVALRLIVEREKEIKAFNAQEYWVITVQVDSAKNPNQPFWVELFEVDGKKIAIKGQDETGMYVDAKAIVQPIEQDLKTAAYTIEKIEKKERVAKPYPPYTTSTLQQAGANVLGWSGKQTMMMAQNLYEAGMITYHRTDSTNLAGEAVEAVRTLISTQFGAAYVPDKPNFYATKSKNAQEAHEAIRPTDVRSNHDLPLPSGMTEKHKKLYELIWKRFVACQMKPAVFDQTTITVKAISQEPIANREYRLKTTGSVIKFEGWKTLYKRDNEEIVLPELLENEQLDYKEIKSEQKETQPPPRFNDASLVKELEKKGIGRPSTYASIISTLITRGYVERTEKRFYPSVLGETVVEFLVKNFSKIMDYDFTAEMEEDLDRIARAEKDWKTVMGVFYKPFAKNVEAVTGTAERMQVPVEETDQVCPTCGQAKLVVRSGRFGKFLSCSRFPECKYTASFTTKLEGFPCPQCGGEVVLKRTKKGRTFWGCKNYPKCEYASWKNPKISQ